MKNRVDRIARPISSDDLICSRFSGASPPAAAKTTVGARRATAAGIESIKGDLRIEAEFLCVMSCMRSALGPLMAEVASSGLLSPLSPTNPKGPLETKNALQRLVDCAMMNIIMNFVRILLKVMIHQSV